MAAGAVETMQDLVHTSIKVASPRRGHTEPTIREQQFPARARLVPSLAERTPSPFCLSGCKLILLQPAVPLMCAVHWVPGALPSDCFRVSRHLAYASAAS